MITTDSTITTTRLQRSARRLLLGACCILLMGVMGAAADRSAEREHNPPAPLITHAPPPMLAAANVPAKAPAVAPAVDDIEALIDHATPAAATETIAAPRTILMEVTAYCPCTRCCGPQAQGITASGKLVSYNNGAFVAADTSVLPFGTKLIIPGYAHGNPVEVIDRGGAIKGNKLDVYFDDHYVALEWGRRWVEVIVAD